MKKTILIFALFFVFTSSIASASWATNVWNNTNLWISNGASISAQKVAENFEYLLGLHGSLCTVHNTGSVRYSASSNIMSYCNGNNWVPIINTETEVINTYAWACTSTQVHAVRCMDEASNIVADGNCVDAKPQLADVCPLLSGTIQSTFIGASVCSRGWQAPMTSKTDKAKIVLRKPFRNGTGDEAFCVYGSCDGLDNINAVARFLGTERQNIVTAECEPQNRNNDGKIRSFDYDDLRDECKGDYIYYVKCNYSYY